jgi:hypothetical protein
VNTYIFTSPRYQPLSLAGARMPGAYLLFFITQTDTPTPVYSNYDLTTELGPEVTADSDGIFPVMYMDPEITYRVQLFAADDTLQYDVDPYTPPRDYPPRTVVWFLGTSVQRDAAYPPELWQVLDGNNGTVDGRDRVPIIAGGDYEAGDTGGSTTAETGENAEVPEGETGETILDAASMPVHNHRLYVRTSSTQRGNTRGFGFASTAGVEGQIIDDAPYGYLDEAPQSGGNKLIEETGEETPTGHTHTVPAIPAHTHPIEGGGLPPFIALWALMRRVP